MRTRRAVLLALALVVARDGLGGDWTITPSVGVGETWTDNVTLAPAGSERHDFVTDVNAGVAVHGTGRRLKLNLNYNLQALEYARGSASSKLNHQLQAVANAELVRQMVFLDVNGSVRQENVSNVGPVADSNVSATGNRSNVVTYSLSPYFRHHFGNYADSEARYTFDTVDSGGARGRSKVKGTVFSLRSGSEFTRVPWTVTVTRKAVDGSGGTTNKFQNIDATVSYRLTRTFTAVLGGGYEDNSFATRSGSPTGLTWSTGVNWAPTPRTSVDAGLRKQFSGTSFYLNARHRSRRTVITASYNEQTSTTTQLQVERQLVPLVDAFGEPILDPDSGQLLVLPVDQPVPVDEVMVLRRFTGKFDFKGRRTGASIGMFHERREFQLSGDEELVYGANLGANRRLSPRTSVNASAAWQRTEPRGAVGEQTRWDVGVGLDHKFARSLSGRADLKRVNQSSEVPTSEYEENRLSVQMKMDL